MFVECLESEGVQYVFGIPGEETLDLNESLADSTVQFVPVRHEQGGAYMADAYGRLTGRAGVCLGTLGPGATNLVTAVADAFLDRSPLVALTGQSDLERMHKESHQYIDLIGIMRPVVKWNARVSSPEIIPEVVRKAFKVAESEKPGSTHLELPEDVMARPLDASPLPRHAPVQPEPGMQELQRATEIIMAAENPIILAGNGAIRTHASRALRAFVHTTGIPVAETFMAKGLLDYEDPHALGTVGLQSRDYAMAGFDDADVVISVGYDLVEHAPEHWNPHADKQIVMIDTVAAEIDEFFMPAVELIGDIAHVLARLAAGCSRKQSEPPEDDRLRRLVIGALGEARADAHFPMRPPRVLADIRDALGRSDLLVSDVGLHKLWIGRMFPAHEPGTVLIANGLAGHGLRAADRDRRQARQPEPQGRHRLRRRRLPDELPGARDGRPAQDADRQRDLGEPAVRLDRLEAGQEVRPPFRRRLRAHRLRQAGRGVRRARLALRQRRRVLPASRRTPSRSTSRR